MTDSPTNTPTLEMVGMIGFGGTVPGGLKVHPDSEHLIYPVGCNIVIENMSTGIKHSLCGHTNDVTCIAVSKSGKYIASGQVTHQGFKAMHKVWDFQTRQELHKMEQLHMVKVEALAFSPNDKYLLSLGGEDDGSVVIWNMATGQSICGSPAQVKSAGLTHTVAFANTSDDVFVTGGDNTLRVWTLDVKNRKIWPQDVTMGQLKRIIKCIEIDDDDKYFYCGTTTGDILGVSMTSKNFQAQGPKVRFSQGITTVVKLKEKKQAKGGKGGQEEKGRLLVGSGDGTICIISEKRPEHNAKEWSFHRTKQEIKLDGAITSIALRGQGHQFYAGTDKSQIYRFNLHEFTHELITTCHYSPINDISFPLGSADLFLTCSYQEIRVWVKPVGKCAGNNFVEKLRIVVDNQTCNAVELMRDGKSIISGWADGKVRAFTPVTGRELYRIENAHAKGVTALTTMSSCDRIITGGKDGCLKVWSVSLVYLKENSKANQTYVTKQLFSFKEHLDEVTCIKVTKNNLQCVSASSDGTCILWNLDIQKREQMIRVNTLFNHVCYHPEECQIITAGTDHKICYWEVQDGSNIREVEGSKSSSINAMDISECGSYFISGSSDQIVKVWNYDGGYMTHLGIGHGAPITRVKLSPGGREIFSVSTDGAIIRWRSPCH